MSLIKCRVWMVICALNASAAMAHVEPGLQVFVNELHYDNRGADRREAVEIAGPTGTDLSGWRLVFYNGSNGAAHDTTPLSGILTDQGGGVGVRVVEPPANVLQNGPDGLALIDPEGRVVQFLSYEGVFPALSGPARGLESTDVGVQESAQGSEHASLQLIGNGSAYGDFVWSHATENSFGVPNPGQTFTVLGAPTTCAETTTTPELATIPTIQGRERTSSRQGEALTVRGVVTGYVATDQGAEGFFLQDPQGDGDPSTSDGLYVITTDQLPESHLIQISGSVVEHFGLTALTNVTGWQDCGDATIVTEVPVDLLSAPVDLEPYEAMRVRIEGPLRVIGNDKLLQLGELTLGSGRHFIATNFSETAPVGGPPVLAMDDASYQRQPAAVPLYDTGQGTHRVGALMHRASGVLGYGYGAFRLHPTAPPVFTTDNPRTSPPPPLSDGLRVAGFNVLNFFSTLAIDNGGNRQKTCGPQQDAECRGAESGTERERQLAKLVATLVAIDADILGLVELENTDDTAIELLRDRVNDRLGTGTYEMVRSPFTGADTIRVAMLYKPGRVQLAGPAHATDPSQDPTFDVFKRPTLAQTFAPAEGGTRFTVAVNHFKSKGSCPGEQDENADQGQGCWNLLRTAQARQLARFLEQVRQVDGSNHSLIVGDLNAYGAEDPIGALEAAGFVDLIKERLPPEDRYSYFSTHGQAAFGYLDHALATPGLAEMVERVAIWHTNSDEPLTLRYNHFNYQARWHADDPYGASDHDPVIVDLGPLVPSPVDPVTLYYRDAQNLSGDALKTALSDIIDDHRHLPYRQIWDVLATAHALPGSSDQLSLLYTGRAQLISRNSGNNNSDQDAWNREHVWPRSHGLGSTGSSGPATDAHNLWPTDASVNQSRGNKDFDLGGTPHHEAPDTFSDGDSWEPRDEVKGEVARTTFYMALRYDGSHGEPDLQLVDRTGTQTVFLGKLCTLLKWHQDDTVSAEEQRRNDTIHAVQGNRNPFIDHPEWAQSIWGDRCPDRPGSTR